MNNQIQLVLKSSTTELSLNDHELGIYLTPELDGLTGLPEIRTTSGVNAGYDGGWTSAQNYDARSITIRGVIANEDVATVEQLRRQLTTLAGQGKNEELTLDLVTQAGKAYTIQARTIALEMSLQKVLTQQEFMLQLRADDPLIYDASETGHEALLQVAQATGGFTIDFELPLAITGSSEETVVNNEGLEQVPTITRMYGALHNPKIINQTTNQFMQIEADLGFAEGDWIEPSEVVSGKDITINGAPEGAPLSSVQIDGDTSQQTYTGKNLVYTSGKTDGGITATYNSATGETTISGKAQRTYVVFGAVADVLPAGTYTFSIQSAAPCAVGVATKASGGTRAGHPISAGATKLTFTISADSAQYDIYLTNLTVDTTYNFTFKAMLESGSTATSFEPYVGGIASPNPSYPQAVQTVTGENVVKICGKNLLYLSGLNATDNGVANTLNNDGSITCSGTVGSGWNGWTIMPYVSNSIQAGTYTLSIGHAINVGMNITFRDSSNTNIVAGNIPAGSTSATITLPRTAAKYSLWINGTTGTAISFTIKAQLELGSTATTYEPYKVQSYEINLGKNLFDKDNASGLFEGYISGGKSWAASGYWSYYIPCKPNTTYTASRTIIGNGGRFAIATSQAVPVSNAAVAQLTQDNTATSLTITTNSSAKYIIVWFANVNDAGSESLADWEAVQQLEKGSQATSYAAYFTPIELCKIGTYQDYIYKSGGKWYVHKETGTKHPANVDFGFTNGCFQTNFKYPSDRATQTLSLSSHFIFNPVQANITSTLANGEFGWNTANYLTMKNTALTSKADWETWLSSNNPVIYYALATPTDTEITNEALVAQLEAILQEARMYNPQTNITTIYAGGNEQGTLSISYFTDKNPDTRDELVIDSRLRTIRLNGLDVYHLQAPGSEFLMLAPGENRLSLQSDITGDNGYAQVSYKQGYLSI